MDFKSICAGLCTAAFLFVAVESGLFLRDLRMKTLPQITLTAQHLDQTVQDLDKETHQLDILIDGSSKVMANVNAAATQEQSFLKLESQRFLEITNSTKLLVQGLDINLNRPQTGLLPKLNVELDQQNAALLALQKQANEALVDLVPIEKNFADTSLVLSDGVKQITPEIVGTSKSVHAAADDGKEVADAYKQKLLHPLRSFWHGVSTVGDVVVKALEAHAYWP